MVAAHQARQSAEQDLGRDLWPVLAGRREQVDDYMGLFPDLVKAEGSSVTNRDPGRPAEPPRRWPSSGRSSSDSRMCRVI